jgi:tRNA nucleotidyltransferase (CCA-adding enzyme)
MFQVAKGDDPVRARRFLARHGDEVAFELVDHKRADYSGKPGLDGDPPQEDLERLERFRELLRRELPQPHRLADLAVNGTDLIEVGYRPGPALGRALHELLHEVVDDPRRNTRDALLRRARAKLTA